MRKLLYIFLAIALFSSCASRKEIEYRDREVLKYISSIQHDTLINNIHDSIYNNIYIKNDTVFSYKYKEKIAYKDRIVYRTDTIRKDSIQIQYKEKQIIHNKIPKWCWYSLLINIFVFGFVIYKIRKKWLI